MITGILLIIFGLKIYDNLDNKIKEILKYLIVGGLTTVVSIVSYYIVRLFIENYLVCTVISWIVNEKIYLKNVQNSFFQEYYL